MAVIKKTSAIKNQPKHLLGIQNLSVKEANNILSHYIVYRFLKKWCCVCCKKSNKNATDATESATVAKYVARRYFLPPQPSSYLI